MKPLMLFNIVRLTSDAIPVTAGWKTFLLPQKDIID